MPLPFLIAARWGITSEWQAVAIKAHKTDLSYRAVVGLSDYAGMTPAAAFLLACGGHRIGLSSGVCSTRL